MAELFMGYRLSDGEYEERILVEKRHVAVSNCGDTPARDTSMKTEKELTPRPEDWGAKKQCGRMRKVDCARCGKTFTTWYAKTKFCSDKCQQHDEAERKRKYNNRLSAPQTKED